MGIQSLVQVAVTLAPSRFIETPAPLGFMPLNKTLPGNALHLTDSGPGRREGD